MLQKITDATIAYLKAQINAGADLVQVFDSWAGVLPAAHYSEFSLKYISRICDAITEVPVTVFAKGAWWALPELAEMNCRTVGLDWNMDPADARNVLPSKTLQGNLDPCVLYADNAEIKKQTEKMLKAFGDHPHIANLGHGVYPDTDPAKVKYFIDCVKELSAS